ncbi:MAG: hypothetical protein JWM16_2524, partial [Verrucomicrobiales bacterium]|nr:hypothetical protein [Verrucomicrobiales bacterium]
MKYFAALLVLTFLCATGSVRADSTVVFNEIMFHPQTNEAQLEWIELYNQMAVDMDISGWYLTNGISYKFAEGTVIQGGGFLVVALSPADLVAATGVTNVLGPFSGRLANGSETLELRNNNNRLMDSVTYGVDGDWPLAPDGSGVSLAKLNPNAGSAEPKNWGISARVSGTPGLANFPVSRATTTSKVIVPIDQTWNYDQSGTNDWSSSSAWLQPNFPEPGWLSGQGLLAYETCGCLPEPIRTQLRTNTSVATFYFRSTFNFTNDPQQVTLSLKHVIDDGMILYLNGVEVWRIGMPAGPVTSSTFANRGITDGAYEGPFTIPASSLIQGTNVLAAEVHQNSATSSDITFGLSIEQLTTIPGGQTEGGGAAPVSFNEVAASTNSAFWLELINYGTTNVSLEGYTVARFGGVYREYVLPAQTLAPGEFLQLTKATLGFAANSGDMLVLYGPGKTSVADAVVAKRKARARFPDGTGAWLFPDQPTVGASNSFAFHKEIVINEIMYDHRGIPASPTIFSTNFMVPITNLWKYNQQGADLGSTWRNAGYNDSTWGSGRALLYNTASILPAPKNTQLALTNPTGGRLVTWYFRSEFVFNGGLSGLQLNLRPIVDDGAVFYLNGVEIYRLNMPDGPIAYTNLASASVATAAYTGPFAVPTNSLVLGTNVLAVEVHQFTTSALGADVVFGAELFGTALTSPPLPYHDSPESWIELYNRGNNAVNLTGWQLSGGIKYSFPTNKTLAAGAYLVIASDVAYLQSLYPGLDIAGPFGGNLSHQSDDILLTDPEGNPANEVNYYSGGRWPQNAHAGGSSLELRDPRSDNSKAEAWADSDEAGKAQWNSYSYRGTATAETAASPSLWKEFVLGMLEAGEVLLDDISVIDLSNSTQLIQNGSFETGLNAWRIVGNHKGRVEVDPDNSANHVLHLTATGPTDHMHNHAETTLAGGVSIVNGRDYQISFRAKWLAGSRDLHTRLYFNRLPKVTTLQVPALNGTPGARNSRYLANAGPTYSGFRHAPAVPNPNQAVTVSVAAQDPDGIATMTLWWALDGGSWNQVPMSQSNGLFRGTILGNSAGTLVQFYVQGTDPLGASSTFPAAGTNSRALLKVNDSQAIFDRLHTIRMLMTTADASLMHAATNVMSNDILSTTVVYDEQQVFYDVGLHLQGSERGRNDSSRVGFTLQFNPDDLFRGVHGSITMDRSGGYAGKGGKHDEIVLKHLINHAGGMPGMYDDLCHVLAPRSQENGTGLLILAKYGDVFLDSQYVNGGNGNLFKLELIYSPTSTSDGTVQGLKLPQPDDVVGTDFQDLGNNKESYRWNFLNENNHTVDDYSQLMNVAKTFSFSGAALDAMSQQTLDVNEWMRVFAFQSIGGVGDTYGTGGGLPHNFMTYIRPDDLKAMAFSWDMDFGYYLSTSAALLPASNVGKIAALPANQRLFYGHLLDMLTTTCNTAYVSKWANHYGSLVGQNWSGITTYFTDRASFILSQLPTTTPFAITSNNGNDFGTN